MGDGNPDIVKHAEGYRYGDPGGADPSESAKSGKPWSIRNAVRRICAAEFDMSPDAPTVDEQIKKLFRGKMTGGQIAAVRKFAQAMKDFRAMENLTNDVDGKLVERNETTLKGDLAAELIAGRRRTGQSHEPK